MVPVMMPAQVSPKFAADAIHKYGYFLGSCYLHCGQLTALCTLVFLTKAPSTFRYSRLDTTETAAIAVNYFRPLCCFTKCV